MRLGKKLLAAALSLLLLISMSANVFADVIGNNPNNVSASEKLALTSVIKAPVGVAVPSETFTYTFTQVIPPSTDTTGKYQKTPVTIAPITVSFSAADRALTDTNEEIQKQIGINLAGVFDRAGVYRYTVAQSAANNLTTLSYCTDIYTVYITVENDSVNGGVKASSIVVVDDNVPAGGSYGTKVDAGPSSTVDTDADTDGNGTPDYLENPVAAGNDFKFLNTYTETKGDANGGDDDGDGTPGVTDNGDGVVPGIGDQVTDKDDLAFELGNTASNANTGGLDLVDHETPVDYVVNVKTPDMDGDGTPDNFIYPNGFITDSTGEIIGIVTPGTPKADGTVDYTVGLKDGEYFYIPELVKGSTVTVSETVPDGTDPYFTAVDNGVTKPKTQGSSATVSIGDGGKSSVIFDNQYNNQTTSPTGVILNNLPYILIAVVAAVVIFFLVIMKRRKDEEEES